MEHKRTGVTVVVSEKMDLSKNLISDKESHSIMINGSIHQEDVIIINICAPNVGVPKYIKQILTYLMGEIGAIQ